MGKNKKGIWYIKDFLIKLELDWLKFKLNYFCSRKILIFKKLNMVTIK